MAIPCLKTANGQEVPQLAFGTWKVPGKECEEAVEQALDMGFRHIDTAQLYKNEEFVGEGIRRFLEKQSAVKRSDLFVVSKLWKGDFTYDGCLESFAVSLAKLKLDYLDCYLMHTAYHGEKAPDDVSNRKVRHDTWRAMEKLLEDGKVKAIGVSNWNSKHLDQLVEDGCKVFPMMNQVEMHPFCYNIDLRKAATEKNMIIEAYSPLGSARPEVLENEVLKEVAARVGAATPQLLLKWNLQHGNVVITRSRAKERLRQALDVFKMTELSATDQALIDALAEHDWRFSLRPQRVA